MGSIADDPYSVLGLPWGASAESIRAAFRKLAIDHHPDQNHADPRAEARFKLITAAYQRLKESGWTLPEPSPPSAANADSHGSPDARPQRWPDGRPIHYPSAQEIAALQRDAEPSIPLSRLRVRGERFLRAFAYLYFAILVASLITIVIAILIGLLRSC